METFKNYLLAKGLAAATAGNYEHRIFHFLTWLDMQNVETENTSAPDIMGYLKHLQDKGYTNATRGVELNIIRQFFAFQIEHEKCNLNPAQYITIRGIKRQTLYPILSREELESIYQNYNVPGEEDERSNRNWFRYYQLSRQRNKTVLGLMIWQGLTTAEVNRLSVPDVKLRQGTIEIHGSRQSATRILELKPQQIIELMEYQLTTRLELLKQQANQEQTAFYLTTPQAGKQSAQNATDSGLNIWKSLSADIKQTTPRFINFHQVRASVLTHWLGQYNLRQVQYMAGHKYLRTTEAYLVNQVEDLKSDIDEFHPIG